MANSALDSSADAAHPQLFGQLGPDIFTVFSGRNRVLYEGGLQLPLPVGPPLTTEAEASL